MILKFNLEHVRYSKFDVKRGIRVPETYSAKLAEETAIHLGDGYLFYDHEDKSYRYGVGLNPRTELDYLEYVRSLIKSLYGYEPKPRMGRVEFMSLAVGTFKRYVLKFPIGTRDGSEDLPSISWIFEKEEYVESFVRGLIDTEGSIKRHSRTLVLVVKMRNSKIISFYNRCLVLLGYRPKIYTWLENSKPIYASVVMGESQIRELIYRVKPRNASKSMFL